MNVKELKALAKERRIKGYYRLRKAELIEILDIQSPSTNTPPAIISMMYVLNEASKRKKYSEPDLFAPGEPCKCECSDDCEKASCEKCKEIREDCKICTKNEAYEMLTTGMVGGPSIVFCRYAEAGVSQIRSQIYEDAKTCRAVLGLDANSLYLFCSGRKCLAERKKFFQPTPKRKTN